LLLEAYGREILGFLVSRLRDESAASDVFSTFAEDLWRGLPGFGWRCSARVWAYTLARHAASRHIREARRRRERNLPLSAAGPLSQIEQKIRTETRSQGLTEHKNRILQLRERLSADDQTLLILRIDRKLAWSEIAQVMLHSGEVAADTVLKQESVRLRKRYQAAKTKLRKLAIEAGFSPPSGDRD
jgi:RNA polymerase sigma-70 factor (ECF subfamily)